MKAIEILFSKVTELSDEIKKTDVINLKLDFLNRLQPLVPIIYSLASYSRETLCEHGTPTPYDTLDFI